MAFAQEVRDFLSGYKAVREMGQVDEKGKLDREKMEADKEYQAAVLALRGEELDLQRQRLAQSAAGAGRAAEAAAIRMQRDTERHNAWREQHEAWREDRARAREDEAAADEAERFEGFATPNPQFDPEDFPTPAYADGGFVSRGATGRWDEPERPPAPALPTGVGPIRSDSRPLPRPTERPAALPGAIPAPSTPERPAQPPVSATQTDPSRPDGTKPPTFAEVRPDVMRIVVSRATEATAAALDSLEQKFDMPRAALGNAPGAPQQPSLEGMSLEELNQMRAAVDPNGTIPDYMKTAALMAEAFSYFQGRGEYDKAVNVGEKILLAERQASQTLGALSIQAMQNGNIAEACQLFNDACNRFPSAHEIRVTPDQNGVLNYVVKNEGEVLEQGKLEARQFLEVAGTVADGSLFMDSVTRFVHQNRPKASSDPNRALVLYGEAQTAAERARVAYEDSMAGSGDGDPELRALADEAAVAAAQAQQQALELGWKTSDLTAASRLAGTRSGAQGDAPVTPQGNLPQPKTKAERDSLPRGTRYLDPNGVERVKQ